MEASRHSGSDCMGKADWGTIRQADLDYYNPKGAQQAINPNT